MSEQQFGDERVVDVDIAERLEQSFLDYSMSVIVGRALPDVRDGLKPVQRRILHAMWEAGLRPDRPHRKCASAVGDVMKKYHPHGDVSIYEALVRMAQDFASREPLIDGQGNFGSIDGDGAAAMRYTEARLSPLAMELLAGLDEDTVDFVPNYDGYEAEPVVLPARFPNLLVNGSSGIAVGMATNIPPHELGETIAAARHLIHHPEATLDDLMAHLPAPDFPTGGRIVDDGGVRTAYETGRGPITVEAVATTETRSGGLPRIIVTEIPYQVNKATLLERIAEHVKNRKLDAVRDLRDESSRDGMRIVIELKRGEDPARVLARLYKLSDLRTTFHANLVALVDGEPRTLRLLETLHAYLDHQREVLTRRTQHRRDQAASRVHVLEGLLTALAHLDEVIRIIREAESADAARNELMGRFDLSEVQATAILDMQLRRLAQLEARRIQEEHDDLVALIAELDAILGDPTRLDGLLSEELAALAERHASGRRTRLAGPGEAPEAASAPVAVGEEPLPELGAQPITVYASRQGYLRSVPQKRTSTAHGVPKDPVATVVRATTDDVLLLVDATGTAYRVALADVPVVTMRQRGSTIAQLLGEAPAAPIVGAIPLRAETASLLTVSARGLVKRTAREEFGGRARRVGAAKVKDGDEIVAALACGEDDELVLAHDAGHAIRFPAEEIRPMGRTATGVAGLKLPAGARVVGSSVVSAAETEQAEILALAEDGSARRYPLDELPRQGRGGKGVQAGFTALAWCGVATDLHLVDDGGARLLRPAEVPIGRRTGRSAERVAGRIAAVGPERGAV
ncbi:DNA topoisomerase 4 subunit A [Egibacter rhizosphaerae]|uniref:DNA topoisomerase (ATP-hydrolyzing) n=1 Tax=Egibacter rhizosphaerae TaxID=1670831 RepID=A0A411YK97_9ACTN|nr:DNA topoisomerase (ATP-hydrolyzing) [Egibacter rhizosphaerae]QBI21639.1 DNA topoisomerase 4 subunit A [Egibacter rhizosphaerae]